LPLRDLGCACNVVSDPLFAGGRLCGRRAVVVRRLVLGRVARAASPPFGCSGLRGVVVRPFVRVRVPYTRRREGRGRTNGRLRKVTGGAIRRPGSWITRWPPSGRVRSGSRGRFRPTGGAGHRPRCVPCRWRLPVPRRSPLPRRVAQSGPQRRFRVGPFRRNRERLLRYRIITVSERPIVPLSRSNG
jgi:hypothetical protein